ncbi:MAG TPA: acyltransferase family protein, partial [Thermoanaerobaculia bacterium]|nr:acyltransferase family protein [Thermoanaerobaculia bacterium]
KAASLLATPRWWEAFPIVDAARWSGFRLFVGLNDTFFMALLFFISGLFVWRSLERKGSGAFLRDRGRRLGLPFLAAAALVAPLAYYPTFVQSGAPGGLSGFVRQWLALGEWPAGPAWFLWVLLAFDAIAALAFARFPGAIEALGRASLQARQRPVAFFALFAGVSALAFIPLLLAAGPLHWFSFGPFYAQTSRLAYYAVYFLTGVAVGAAGLERGLLTRDSALARRWGRWLSFAFLAFAVDIVVFLLTLAPHASPKAWSVALGAGFALASAALSFAFLALCLRFAQRRNRALDSLRANAYGMYLTHYAFVSWLQLAILKLPLSGLAKGCLVTAGTVALSWGLTAALRRVPGAARIL